MSQSNPVNQIAQDLLTLQATGALTSLSSFGSAAAAAAAASVRQSTIASTPAVSATPAPVSTPATVLASPSKAEFFSETEASILRSKDPISIHETEEITALGQRGIWANRKEVSNWKSDVPITEYFLNEDSNPEIIFKKAQNKLEYVQELAIRYLRPPTPPSAGEIVITQEPNTLTPPAPPLVIRQQPARPSTPEPLIVREAPPKPPVPVGRKLITISGKRLPPPPRKVVIERLAPIPAKPQAIIAERWLPYTQQKRKVIFRSAPPDPIIVKPRNVVIQWEAPEVTIRKEIKNLGVVRANPNDYVARYGETLRVSEDLPQIVKDIPSPDGMVLAANYQYNPVFQLEGEVDALKLIDLEREGLGEYRAQLIKASSMYSSANTRNSMTKSIMSLESLISNKMATASTGSFGTLTQNTSSGPNSFHRNTYASNAQSILQSRNTSLASTSQVNGQLVSSGQTMQTLKSSSNSNNQMSAQSIQSFKNSSVVSGAASTMKLANPSSNTLAGLQSIQSLTKPQPTGISVSTQISAASSLQSLKNPSATSAVQGISVSTQISGAPSIPSLKNASGSMAGSESMSSFKTGANSAASMKSNSGTVASAKSAAGSPNPMTPAPSGDQSLRNASASSVVSANSLASGKQTAQSQASIGSHSNMTGETNDLTNNDLPAVVNSASASAQAAADESNNNISLELSSNEGSLGQANETVLPTETSIHIEIVPAGQPTSATQSASSMPSDDVNQTQSAVVSNATSNITTNKEGGPSITNNDGVYTLETLSSSSSVQMKD